LARSIYFKGLADDVESARRDAELVARLPRLRRAIFSFVAKLPEEPFDESSFGRIVFAVRLLSSAEETLPTFRGRIRATDDQALHRAQIELEIAAESFGATAARRSASSSRELSFGGDR